MSFGDLITYPRVGNSDGSSMGSRFVAEILPHSHSNNKPTGVAIAQFPLSLSLKTKMEGHSLIGDHFDPMSSRLFKDDDFESRSGSETIEGGSYENEDQEQPSDGKKKKYHRHTPQQIQDLEACFKECPHPDEKQRMELSRRLGMQPRQIKFWFQNRRTQMKTQMERHENTILRQENDRLRAENDMLKEGIRNPVCNSCGGPTLPADVSNYELQQFRIENARLKDELGRACILANKFLGRPLMSSPNPMPPQSLNSGLELAVGRNEFGGVTLPGSSMQTGLEFVETKPPIAAWMGNGMQDERNMLFDLALAAMDQLIKMAQPDSPLWMKSSHGGNDILNEEEYMRTFSPIIGMKQHGFVTEASRETGSVLVNSLALAEALMDANRWVEMFPCMISRAITSEIISSGMSGTKNGALQVMLAEFQVLSPLVPVRQLKFLRFCKQHAEGMWAVVDVSINANHAGGLYANCRKLPSGFVVQDMPNGYSKITWIEHSEYDNSTVHNLCLPLLSSGMGFGAQRWVATLQRQCECLEILMSSAINSQVHSGINPLGMKSMLNLARRLTYNFCSGVCGSSAHKWDKLSDGNVGEDVRVLTRTNMNDPGEPSGVVLFAATSVWIQVTRQRLFDFMRDERMRSEWDILSNEGLMEDIVHIPMGQEHGNCISLLRARAKNAANESNMLILQETWNDASGSLIVYAPVDVQSVNMVMSGGDSSCVPLVPSGFAILPDGQSGHGGEGNGSNESRGCILTVGFQIFVNNLPTGKLTVESVETINNLIAGTIGKIQAAIQEI